MSNGIAIGVRNLNGSGLGAIIGIGAISGIGVVGGSGMGVGGGGFGGGIGESVDDGVGLNSEASGFSVEVLPEIKKTNIRKCKLSHKMNVCVCVCVRVFKFSSYRSY